MSEGRSVYNSKQIMPEKTCPYLGIIEDRETTINFSSDANGCWKTDRARAIPLDHQDEVCLTENFPTCPIYVAPVEVPAPAPRFKFKSIPVRKLLLVFAGLLLILTVSIFGADLIRSAVTALNSLSTDRSSSEEVMSELVLIEDPNTVLASGQRTPTSELQATTVSNIAAEECPLPDEFIYYFIQPDEDIEILVQSHGITLDHLLEANCLSDATQLTAGLMVVIPAGAVSEPTATPSPSPTHTATKTATITSTATPTPTPTPTSTHTAVPLATITNPPKPTKEPDPTSVAPPARPSSTPPSGRDP